MVNEWDAFKISFGEESNAANLETVRHVVHVATARRILEDKHLKAGLIYDESRLKTSRVSVTWVSANTWGPGSIYGNVEFEFPWKKLIEGRRCYWVEAMKYNPPAYRLLLTDRDLSSVTGVTPYDPEKDEGPLRRQDGAWYWQREFTSEFMVEADVPLSDCTGFHFIAHHPKICRLDPKSCKERGADVYRTGGRVLAFVLGNGVHGLDHVLKNGSGGDVSRTLSKAVDIGADGIRTAFTRRSDPFVGPIFEKASRKVVMRGALALYGADQWSAAKELVSLLKSDDVFEEALCEVVAEHFNAPTWTLPEDF